MLTSFLLVNVGAASIVNVISTTKGRKFPKFRPTKRCVISLNQRASNDDNLCGSNRTLVAMDYSESADTILKMNHQFVKSGSHIMCDENPVYSGSDFHYTRWSVNHQEAYSYQGINNRQKSNCELFNDILKRCLWVLPLIEWVGYW